MKTTEQLLPINQSAFVAQDMTRSALRQAAHFKAGGHIDDSEQSLLRAAALAPDNWRTLCTLGHLRFERRHFAAATGPLGAAVELAADEMEPRKLYANALHMAYREQDAGAQLREVMRRHPEDVENIHNLGLYLYRLGRLPDAEMCFRRAMRLKPDWPTPYRALAQVFRRAGRLDKANAYLRRALRMQYDEPPDSTSPALCDATLAEGVEKDGLAIDSVEMPCAGNQARLIRFPRAVVERGTAIPITPGRRLFSDMLGWQSYPEHLDFLWNVTTQRAIAETFERADDFIHALILPGYVGNYAHWLIDVLPSLLALKAFKPRELPILVVDKLPQYRVDSLTSFLACHGFPEMRVAIAEQPLFSVRNAFFVTGVPRAIQIAAIAALRSPVEPQRRLFVGRRDTRYRRLINEDAVFATLEPLGFERVDPNRCSFGEQVEMFSRASVVVGLQGAALANCTFCAPGTPLVIVYPYRVMPYYEDLATHIPLRMIPVEGIIVDGGSHTFTHHCDFTVSPDSVRAAALQALG